MLRFTCQHCDTHLGVDPSLAGTIAPCPKCGSEVKAPSPDEKFERIRGSGVTRGVSGGSDYRSGQNSPSARQKSRSSTRESSGKARQVYPSSGRMASEDEKANLRVLLKILIATSLVILVVVLVVWYLKNQ